MGFIETSYSNSPNLSQVNIDSNLNMDNFGISAGGDIDFTGAVNLSGGLDLNNTDLVGVKRFICDDFMSAIKATASDNIQQTIVLNDLVAPAGGEGAMAKKFRIPSNFVSGSTLKIKVTVSNPSGNTGGIYLNLFDSVTYAYISRIVTYSIAAYTTEQEISLTLPNTISAGDLCGFSSSYSAQIFGESKPVKLCYDYDVISDAVWEVITT